MFDDFDTQVQIDEIIPEEYEDWLRFCAGAYEASEYEKYDHFEDELGENCLDEIEASLGRDRDYFPTWAPGGCDEDETVK